jgi:poly-beta-1,6-N-acetyl-D-glucosamine synthase
MSQTPQNIYVLVTAARNEDSYIEKTIKAVVSQTILPRKWIIVSDGSTDRTDEIVQKYGKKYKFIKLVQKKGQEIRDFSSKVYALHAGFEEIKNIDYEFIGVLDADVTFEPDYYENMLKKFQQNKNLGVAGGTRFDYFKNGFKKVICAKNSAGGPTQFFRRLCFEHIEFKPLKIGGEDSVAEIMARMNGWQVETFSDVFLFHHRPTGTEGFTALSASFRIGKADYSLGYHPLFEIARSISRISNRPIIIGSIYQIFGFCWSYLKRDPKLVSEDFIKFLRHEQLQRLKDELLPGKKKTRLLMAIQTQIKK